MHNDHSHFERHAFQWEGNLKDTRETKTSFSTRKGTKITQIPAIAPFGPRFGMKSFLCLSIIANRNGRPTAAAPTGRGAAKNELHVHALSVLFDPFRHEHVHGPEAAGEPRNRN